MFNDILRRTTSVVLAVVLFLIVLSTVCGLPVDEDVRIETLREMRKYMNESAEPCNNFYEFACGNWPKYHKSPNLLEIIAADFAEKVATLMETDDPADTEREQKVKHFYQSCLKIEDDKHMSEYFENMINVAIEFGAMPAFIGDDWQEETFDWQETVASMQYKYGVDIILMCGPSNDIFDSSVYAMYCASAVFDAKSNYADDKYVTERIESMTLVMTKIFSISAELAAQTAKDMFAFEKSLVQGKLDENLGASLDNLVPTTMDKLQNTYAPTLNMTKFVSTSFGSTPSYTYYEDRKYLENLVKVIQTTSKKTVANYIYYKFFNEFYLRTSIRTYCMAEVKKHFGDVFENIAYRKFTSNNPEKDLEVMWNDIKWAFEHNLNSPDLNWIHSDARQYAIEKLNNMNIEVPSSKINENSAISMYQYTVDKENFFENLRTIRILEKRRERAMVNEPPKPTIGTELLNTFSPINIITYNKVAIPVSVLQGQYFFSSSLPSALNFGRLGTVLGHEILHGFDNNGRKYDKVGSKREWWDKESVDAFNERVMCFVDQYQYEYEGKKLPRRMNQGENIADNGGTRMAYQAYLKWYQDSARTPQELKLETFPGFPYNNKQLFFISYAQEWCSNTTPEMKKQLLEASTHTPVELRTMAVLSNMNEFSEEFNCPLGSAMNPIKKCKVY